MKAFIKGVVLYLLMFLIILPSNSQTRSDSINIYELSIEQLMALEAEVASLVERDVKKQPVSLVSITRKQLELSGARTLADALSIYVPGFFVVEDQDDVIAGFRGLAPDNNSKVMLMINGQNLNIEWFWGPPPAILNTTNFDFIEKIEVIRGPGSVVLGQGALLGVINIVTRSGKSNSNSNNTVSGSAKPAFGMNGFYGVQADMIFSDEKTNGYLFLGLNNFDGQQLRNQGWASDKNNEGYKGGSVSDIGTRLKKSKNNSLIGNIHHKGFDLNIIAIDHEQDLYNFYRDRNCFGETLISISPSYQFDVNPNIIVKTQVDATIDDFSLKSVDGYTMGGTRENRYGGKVVCNINEIISGNRLAVGTEFRRFEFGHSNFSGNNFINNVVSPEMIQNETSFIAQANINKIWGYKSNINVFSFFAEDIQTLGDYLNLFTGVRFDQHPFWGSNISPRVGAIVTPISGLRIRLSYQTGFRGAVGLHYGGGYKQDGLLSEDNFNIINDVQIPVFDNNNQIIGYEQNLPATEPESMQGFEIALDWDINNQLNLYGVCFYNIVANVIDVGVIWRDPTYFEMVNIGSDVPGDWNGYWFFKNTQGEIIQGGFESVLSFRNRYISTNFSHSFVRVVSSSTQQRGSMYITEKGNFKAYPENVSRVNILGFPTKSLSVGCNYLFYYRWFSPSDQKVKANHLVNLALGYDFSKNINCTINCTNVFNQTELYPMNSNVGDVELSDGTPVVENTSLWLSLKYRF